MKIGILTGGGDCAGINSAIRGATFAAEELNHELYGIKNGWEGLIKYKEMRLNSKDVEGIGEKSGTILGTSRTNPFKCDDEKDKSSIVLENLKKNNYNSLIAIGGEDTLGVACKLDKLGFPVIGIPKTMDYDLQGYSLGFDTAVERVRDHLVDLRTTTSSHRRVFVIEVFGRNTGHVAFEAGLAGMADVILIPEIPYDINVVCNDVKKIYEKRKREDTSPFAIVVAAEGAMPIEKKEKTYTSSETDEFGHKKLGGISEKIANQIRDRLSIETKHMSLEHIPRSGPCGCFDAYTGEKFGRAAVYLAQESMSDVAVTDLRGEKITTMKLEDIIVQKPVDIKEVPLYEKRVSFGRPKQKYKPKIKAFKKPA
ncbi:MAG: ATP-dependent 6-phosphofructokinase [Candidatus Aenigmatarchaeota archaeon]